MDEVSKKSTELKTEMARVIVYLSFGAADVCFVDDTKFALKRKGSNPFEGSAKALAYLARKNWIKRDGKQLRITDSAPSTSATNATETMTAELVENGSSRTITRVVVESPIDYLASRNDKNGVPLLGKSEWSAGDRLRSDFTRANMLPGIGMRWGEPIRVSGGAGGGVTQTDAAMAAKARVTRALDAVGPEFSGLLIDVCCFLKGLEMVEAERGWPKRSAKLMLRAGLGILARHYAPPARQTVNIRNWGSEDYRPTL
jgi:Domain of unknown function (DUF6456)